MSVPHSVEDVWLLERLERSVEEVLVHSKIRGKWARLPAAEVVRLRRAALAMQRAIAAFRAGTGITNPE